MELHLPSWIKSWLSLFNLGHIYLPPWDIGVWKWDIAGKGDWLTLNLNIGDWITTALEGALWVVEVAINGISSVIDLAQSVGDIALDWAVSAYNLAQDAKNAIAPAVKAVKGELMAFASGIGLPIWEEISSIRSTINGLWDKVNNLSLGTPVDVIEDLINSALAPWRAAFNTWSFFSDEISEFFGDPEEYIINKLESALERFW